MEDGDSIDVMVERKYHCISQLIRVAIVLRRSMDRGWRLLHAIPFHLLALILHHCTFATPPYLFAYMRYKYLAS